MHFQPKSPCCICSSGETAVTCTGAVPLAPAEHSRDDWSIKAVFSVWRRKKRLCI